MSIFIGFSIILLTAIGQILLKKSANEQKGHQFLNGLVITGYIAFLITVFLSYYLMKAIPLKHFIVIMSCSYVVVMIGAIIFLKESITKNRILGTMLIAFGVFVFLLK